LELGVARRWRRARGNGLGADTNPSAAGTLGARAKSFDGGAGGYHIAPEDEQESIRIIRTALDSGINFLDNCWDYNGGASEERMGKALRDGYGSARL